MRAPETPLEFNQCLSVLVDRYIDWFQQLSVQPDSIIDLANKRMTRRSYQETVWVPIMVALDHFRLVTTSVATLRAPLPFAHATPLRTAITAAATSLWAMDDDADTRILRAAVLNYHDAENYRKYLDGRPADKVPDAAAAAATQRLIAEHWAAEALKLGEDVTRKGWRPTADFSMVEQAAQRMPDWSDGWRPATEVPSQWRMLSCFAHGMRWATAPHVRQGEADADGFAPTTFVFDPDMLMESAGIVQKLIEHALNRYREMAGHPPEKSSELASIRRESMNLN